MDWLRGSVRAGGARLLTVAGGQVRYSSSLDWLGSAYDAALVMIDGDMHNATPGSGPREIRPHQYEILELEPNFLRS